MGKFIDLTGQKFGRLTVIKRVENKGKNTYWLCKCDCGNIKSVRVDSLKNGSIKSCGCYQKEMIKKCHTIHNKCHTRLHSIWSNMKQRCFNKNAKRYSQYGGRGITVCEEWKNDFMSFYDWAMANGYNDNLTIDRIDVNGNYEPNNCKWATNKEQQNNRQHHFLITYKGITKNLQEWCEEVGLSRDNLYRRLVKYKWSVEKALNTPVLNKYEVSKIGNLAKKRIKTT